MGINLQRPAGTLNTGIPTCTVHAAFQKQGLWGQKNVGQKDAAYLFAHHFSAHHAVVRCPVLARQRAVVNLPHSLISLQSKYHSQSDRRGRGLLDCLPPDLAQLQRRYRFDIPVRPL